MHISSMINYTMQQIINAVRITIFFPTGDYIIFAVGEVDLIVESHKGCNERHIKVVGI